MEVTYTGSMSPAAGPRRQVKSFDELWDDLLRVPEGTIGEIIDGEIVETQRPGIPHVIVTSNLGTLLGAWFRFGIGGPGGWRILDEPGIRFGNQMRIPDLAGWRAERFPAMHEGPMVVMPDWICEALSPSTARSDRTAKLPLYAHHGVRHVWLLDGQIQTLEVYRLENGRWSLVGAHAGGDKVRAEPFDAVELDLGLVWDAGATAEPGAPSLASEPGDAEPSATAAAGVDG